MSAAEEPSSKQQKSSETQVAHEAAEEPRPAADAQTLTAILTQVQFYFGDSNYGNDKFLNATAASHDGWVPISVVLTFKRMLALQCTVADVAAACAESDVVRVNEAGDALQRKHPVVVVDALPRTLYSSGYPDGVTWEAVSAYWARTAGVAVAATRLHRKKKVGTFTGAAYVEFESEAGVAAVLGDDKGPYEWGEGEAKCVLHVSSKAEWLKAESEKRRAEQEAKRAAREAESAADDADIQYTAGCIVKVDGLGIIPARDELKDAFEPYGEVEYVDYGNDAVTGCIRFSEPDMAQAALDAFAGGRKEIFGKTPELSLLEGDTEKEYWQGIRRAAKERNNRRGNGRRRKGKRSR